MYVYVIIIFDNRGGNMKNNKAQALIEFVLILPILIMFLFSIIDFGNIYVSKSHLENKLNDVYDFLKESKSLSNVYDEVITFVNKDEKNRIGVELTTESENDYLKIALVSEIQTITPGLNLILGSPYEVRCERVIKYVK